MVGGRRPPGQVVIPAVGGFREKVVGFLGRARGESVVVAVARLMSAGCSLLIAVISARHLGPTGRGEIVFVVTVSMLGSEFVSLGANVSGRIQVLRRAGVEVTGKVRIGLVPEEAYDLSSHTSVPLSLVLRGLNKFSNNVKPCLFFSCF